MKTHNLEDLVVMAGKKDSEILRFKDKVAELTPFAVESRYPEFEEPSLHDTKKFIKTVIELREYILIKVGLKF